MKKLLATTILFAFVVSPFTAFASTQIFMTRTLSTPRGATINQAISSGQSGAGGTTYVQNGILPIGGTFSNLYAYTLADPNPGNWTVTLEDGTTLESLTCTISSGSTTCSDTNGAHNFTASAGDIMSIKWVAASSPTVTMLYNTIEFTPTTANQNAMMFTSLTNTIPTSGYHYLPYASLANNSSVETANSSPIPETGTFQDLYVNLSNPLTSGDYTHYLRNETQNATSTITCTNTTNTVCTDTSDTYTTANADDQMDIAVVSNAPSTARAVGGGIGFTPSTAGDFIFSIVTASNYSGSVTDYSPLSGAGTLTVNTIEASSSMYADTMTITKLSASVNTSVATGKTRVFTLMDGGSPTSATCSISVDTGNGTTCTWTGSVSITRGDLIDTQEVPSGSPAVTTGAVSYIATVSAAPAASSRGQVQLVGGMCLLKGGSMIVR